MAEFLAADPDYELAIHSSDSVPYRVGVNKTDLCRQSNYFYKLFTHDKTACEITLPFDKDIIEKCLQIISFIASIRSDLLIASIRSDYVFGLVQEPDYITNIKSHLLELVNGNFIAKLQCLDYLDLRSDNIINFILEEYNLDQDFEIDKFIQLDFIPLNYRWGYWSLYGNLTIMPTMPIKGETLFIPFYLTGRSGYDFDYNILRYSDGGEQEPTIIDGVRFTTGRGTTSGFHYDKCLKYELLKYDDGGHLFDVKMVGLCRNEYPQMIEARKVFIGKTSDSASRIDVMGTYTYKDVVFFVKSIKER